MQEEVPTDKIDISEFMREMIKHLNYRFDRHSALLNDVRRKLSELEEKIDESMKEKNKISKEILEDLKRE